MMSTSTLSSQKRKSEAKFVAQGPYENRDVFTSLDIPWTLPPHFPQELLKNIPQKVKDAFYDRENEVQAAAQALKRHELQAHCHPHDDAHGLSV